MSHDHAHFSAHTPAVSERRLKFSVALTLAFVVAEGAAGWFSNSLALMSDAGHNFADALALGFSWYALSVARKASTRRMTFGYHRVGILAALVNAVSLVLIAIGIGWEAWVRLSKPEAVNSAVMIGIAAVAVVVNLLIGFWLHGGRDDINIRSAYIHMLGDAISSFGVVIAGVIVWLTGKTLPDPIVSFLIAALIVYSSLGILKESVNVLLEGSPENLDMSAVERCIAGVDGVRNVHDLHVWTVGPGVVACSCHIVVSEQTIASGNQILKTVVEALEHQFRINHTTVQVEVEGCGPNEMYCRIHEAHGAEPHHH